MIRMPGKSHTGPLPALSDEERALSQRIFKHVDCLAGLIGPRNMWAYDALLAAAKFIETQLAAMGFIVASQSYEIDGKVVRNLEVEIRGARRPEQIVVIGAHYDSVPNCPAANDNASGVAGVLEIARMLSGRKPDRTVRCVAFVNEEPPFFQTDRMGSLVYARACRQRGDDIVGMISLETIGYYRDERGSQSYPFPFNLFHPSRGDFIGFAGDFASGEFVRRCVGSFRRQTQFPSQGISGPRAIAQLGWSDHWSFWQAGYAALMVTDTAPFRYPHYHRPSDTPDKLDYDRTARVVAGMSRVVADIASEEGKS